MSEFLINQTAQNYVESLIKQGWEFCLCFGLHAYSDFNYPCWEASFTRSKGNGLWDNHKSGFDKDVSEAIMLAVKNVENGNRVGKTPQRTPDYVSDSGSKYWYVGDSVIRQSDHWGNVASCYWTINYVENGSELTGVCSLSDFKSITQAPEVKGKQCFDLVFAIIPSMRGYKKLLLCNAVFERIGNFLYCKKLDICCEYLYVCR